MDARKAFLVSPWEMFKKMKSEFEDFKNDPKSSRHAINFVLTAHHLREWVWKSYLEKNETLRNKISSNINEELKFYTYVNNECSEMKVIRELANNIKHFYHLGDQIKETSDQKPLNEITCEWQNFQVPYGHDGLIIITQKDQWVSVLTIFEKINEFWTQFFDSYF